MAMRRATMMRRVTLCGFSSSQSSMYFLIFSLVMFTYFEYCFFSFRLVFNPTSVVETSYEFCKLIVGKSVVK